MTDLIALFASGVQTFTDRVHAVKPQEWTAATPDTKWTVADLVGHLVDEHRWAAELLDGDSFDLAKRTVEEQGPVPTSGDALVDAWDDAASASLGRLNDHAVLHNTVELSRGETPVPDYLSEMIFDLAVHSWDLEAAIRYKRDHLPAELVEYAYGQAQNWGDLSASPMFGKARAVADSSPTLVKLVALTGRDPDF